MCYFSLTLLSELQRIKIMRMFCGLQFRLIPTRRLFSTVKPASSSSSSSSSSLLLCDLSSFADDGKCTNLHGIYNELKSGVLKSSVTLGCSHKFFDQLKEEHPKLWTQCKDSGIMHSIMIQKYDGDMAMQSKLLAVIRDMQGFPIERVPWKQLFTSIIKTSPQSAASRILLSQCLEMYPAVGATASVSNIHLLLESPATPDLLEEAIRVGSEEDPTMLFSFLFQQESHLLEKTTDPDDDNNNVIAEIDPTLVPNMEYYGVFSSILDIIASRVGDGHDENWNEALLVAVKIVSWMDGGKCVKVVQSLIRLYLSARLHSFAFSLFKMIENEVPVSFLADKSFYLFCSRPDLQHGSYISNLFQRRFTKEQLAPYQSFKIVDSLKMALYQESRRGLSFEDRKKIVVDFSNEKACPEFFLNDMIMMMQGRSGEGRRDLRKNGSRSFELWVKALRMFRMNEKLQEIIRDEEYPWSLGALHFYIQIPPRRPNPHEKTVQPPLAHLSAETLSYIYYEKVKSGRMLHSGSKGFVANFVQSFVIACCLKDRLDLLEDLFIKGCFALKSPDALYPIFATLSGRSGFQEALDAFDGCSSNDGPVDYYLKWIRVFRSCFPRPNRASYSIISEPLDGNSHAISLVNEIFHNEQESIQ